MSGLRRGREIEANGEYRRICDLPRRTPEIAPSTLAQLDNLLRKPAGEMHLRPVQALALHDIGTTGGLLAPIRVGGGKTLVSLLAPYVLQSKRPLLLIPAGLIKKTEDDRRKLSAHWLIPRHIRIMSYEALGRSSAARELEIYAPDLIIADEAHKLKNPKAACTRRVKRYMRDHPEVKMLVMSGTLIKRSLRDFGPLSAWALKEGSPVPIEDGTLIDWADALDEKVNPLSRLDPGVLGASIEEARAWFQARLLSTPGVVATPGEQVGASLYITGLPYDVNEVTEDNFRRLRGEWVTPDGWGLSMATEVWRHARELALGLHYVWDPRPPAAWLNARRDWASFVRETIKNTMYANEPLDSELQVANAVDRGDVDDDGLLERWRLIRPTFTINSKPVWHDDSALLAAESWMASGPGIVWCEHTFFARELSRRTGAPYFGAGGETRSGERIESERGDRPIVASMAANGVGRNLQAFSRNLVTSWPSGADQVEQLLGRTHRDGQQADEVTVDILVGCAEHLMAWEKSRTDALMHEQMLGQPQKLIYADVDWPDVRGTTPRWVKTCG